MRTNSVQQELNAPVLTRRTCITKSADSIKGVDVSMVINVSENTRMRMVHSPRHVRKRTNTYNHSSVTNGDTMANVATLARIAGIGHRAKHA